MISAMSPSEWADDLGQAASRTIDLASHRLDAVVPSCPQWRGRDLVAHIATRPTVWSLLMSTQPGAEFPVLTVEELQPLIPDNDDMLVAWAHKSVSAYTRQLHGLNPAMRTCNQAAAIGAAMGADSAISYTIAALDPASAQV
jgi:Mycothiol maleylpyruvate isomerase N-terminal domain